jgi:hypothetical protein
VFPVWSPRGESRSWEKGLEIAHEAIEALLVLGFGERGEVSVDDGGGGAFVAEIDLELAEVLALLKQVCGVGMAKGVRVGGLLDAAGFECPTKRTLDSGATKGMIEKASGGGMRSGEEKRRVFVGFPMEAKEFQSTLGQRNVAVDIAFGAADVKEHAFAVDIADAKIKTFAQTQAAGVEEREEDAVAGQSDAGKQSAHFTG